MMANFTLAIAIALRLADRPGELITRTEIEAEADCRGSRPKLTKKCRSRRIGHAIRWLRFLGRLQPPATAPRPYDDYVAQFSDSQSREYGLSPNTIADRSWWIHMLLTQVVQADLRLDTLTIAQVDELLTQTVRDHEYARATVRKWVSALRSFFRFAEERKWCRPGLADEIRAPRQYTYAGLPIGPSWDDVKRLLAAAESDRPTDIRDRALLMLLAVYGLRAEEVTALRLEDFDWQREVLTVPCGKRQQPRAYPFCRPVCEAVLRYLREVRPRSERQEVFLTLVAPFTRLNRRSLSNMVTRRLRALGLILSRYGSHVLRHACASHLLARGLSLKEIGDHLGHRHPDSTRIYAKVDLAALRVVADFDLEGLL